MIAELYVNSVLRERRDDTTRTVTTYNAAGTLTGTRPYTTAENAAADAAAAAETARAEQAARAATAEAVITATVALMDQAHTDGQPWVQPLGAHDAYPLGAKVAHKGKTWANLTPANVWIPGTTGWREVVAEGPAPWVQPTGGHDAYPLGAKVAHKGKTWTSIAAANVWEPGVFGWV